MIHLKTLCDTRRQKKDDTYPIVFRITLNRKQQLISSGFSCHLKDWDASNNTVYVSNQNLKNVALRLKEKEYSLLEKIRPFEVKYSNCMEIKEVLN